MGVFADWSQEQLQQMTDELHDFFSINPVEDLYGYNLVGNEELFNELVATEGAWDCLCVPVLVVTFTNWRRA